MVYDKNILVVGARSGGYGASIAQAAVRSGAQVFGTSLTPEDPREQAFFREIGTELIDVPLRFDSDRRSGVLDALARIEQRLMAQGVEKLDAVIHTVAGGFPRQPSVMKAVSDILKGKQTFFDMATGVRRNVYYVNGGSFEDLINSMPSLTDEATQYLALTYRGALPYFIAHTKRYLEKIAERAARKGKLNVVAALPEAWTQSSQFFTGIELAVFYNYLSELKGQTSISEDIAPLWATMEASLAETQGLDRLISTLEPFYQHEWEQIVGSSDVSRLNTSVRDLFGKLRNEDLFTVLRRAVEVISGFVRDASGILCVRELLVGRRYEAGDVRQITYKDLSGTSQIPKANPREEPQRKPSRNRKWLYFEKDAIRNTLSMYGENFLFIDRVIMEDGGAVDGRIGFGRFTVPTPKENPILKDHFVGMPLFGGHLQMEAVAQLGTFMMLQILKGRRLFPILTGTEFPDLNTMAPPGETLTMVGVIRLRDKRDLARVS